jgi:hypothetical protein
MLHMFEGTGISSTGGSFSKQLRMSSAATIIFMGGIDNSLQAESFDQVTTVWPDIQLNLHRNITTL